MMRLSTKRRNYFVGPGINCFCSWLMMCLCKTPSEPGAGKTKDIELSIFSPWLKTYSCLQSNLLCPELLSKLQSHCRWNEESRKNGVISVEESKIKKKLNKGKSLYIDVRRKKRGLMHWLNILLVQEFKFLQICAFSGSCASSSIIIHADPWSLCHNCSSHIHAPYSGRFTAQFSMEPI